MGILEFFYFFILGFQKSFIYKRLVDFPLGRLGVWRHAWTCFVPMDIASRSKSRPPLPCSTSSKKFARKRGSNRINSISRGLEHDSSRDGENKKRQWIFRVEIWVSTGIWNGMLFDLGPPICVGNNDLKGWWLVFIEIADCMFSFHMGWRF